MIKIEVLKNETFKTEQDLPKRGSEFSTGYDIVATSDPKIVGDYVFTENNKDWYGSISYIQYDTSLHIAPEYYRWKMQMSNQDNPTKTEEFNSRRVDYYDTLIMPRSSISKYNLTLANSVGLIDNDYRNSIGFRFKYTIQPEDLKVFNDAMLSGLLCSVNFDKIYKKGDKIGQLKFTKVIDAEFVLVDNLNSTKRGLDGFGSTGV